MPLFRQKFGQLTGRVEIVVAVPPGQHCSEGGEGVENTPSQDDIIVNCHKAGDHQHTPANACKK